MIQPIRTGPRRAQTNSEMFWIKAHALATIRRRVAMLTVANHPDRALAAKACFVVAGFVSLLAVAAVSQKEKEMIERRNREWDEAQRRKKAQAANLDAKRRTSLVKAIPQLRNKKLERLEEITADIQQWNRHGFEVAKHLREVRDDELYLEKYDSLEEYGLREFNWQHSQTYAMASWADVRLGLPAAIAETVATESQARALSVVKESKREAVVDRALKSSEQFTAKAITKAIKPHERKKKPKPVVIDVKPETSKPQKRIHDCPMCRCQ